VGKFEERMSAKIKRQEKLDRIEENDFRRRELPGKYTVKTLYGWDNGKFEEVGEKLVKMEVSFSGRETLKGGNVKVESSELYLFSFSFLFSFFL